MCAAVGWGGTLDYLPRRDVAQEAMCKEGWVGISEGSV